MKAQKSAFTARLVLACVIIGTLFSVSCRKNKECTGIITVVTKDTAAGAPLVPVMGATVQLAYGNLNEKSVTDSEGRATFILKLPATPNVYCSKGALIGQSYIKLEPGETVEKTVEIQ